MWGVIRRIIPRRIISRSIRMLIIVRVLAFSLFAYFAVAVDEGGVDDSTAIVDPQLKHWMTADDGSGYNATFPRNQAVSLGDTCLVDFCLMLILFWWPGSTTGAVSQLRIMGSPHLSFGLSSLATNPTPNSRRIRIRIAQQAPRWLTDNSPTHSSYHSLLSCTLVPYSISTPGHSDLFPFPRSFSSRIFLVLSRSFRSLALARYIADVCVCVITPRSRFMSSFLLFCTPSTLNPSAQSKPVHSSSFQLFSVVSCPLFIVPLRHFRTLRNLHSRYTTFQPFYYVSLFFLDITLSI